MQALCKSLGTFGHICMHVWWQGCAYLQNYPLAVEVRALVNSRMTMFLNLSGSFCMMHLKMNLKNCCIPYFFSMDNFPALVVSDVGEQMTNAQQEQERGLIFKQTIQRHCRIA